MFQNAPLEAMKLDSAGRDTFARDVATFASVSQTGPLTVTKTGAPYSFRSRDLP